jgi:hypothetical protein
LESTYPRAPGDTLFDLHQHHYDHVVLWPDRKKAVGQDLGDPDWGISPAAEPGFVRFQTVGTAEPLILHRIRNVGGEAITHDVSERSPSEKRLTEQANGRGTFIGGNSEERA